MPAGAALHLCASRGLRLGRLRCHAELAVASVQLNTRYDKLLCTAYDVRTAAARPLAAARAPLQQRSGSGHPLPGGTQRQRSNRFAELYSK